MNTLGDRLIYLRNKRKFTAADVKERININDLGRFEKNERKPSLDTLLAIANFYNVSTDWLLTGKDNDTVINSISIESDLILETPSERHILRNFREMPEEEQQKLINATARVLLANEYDKKISSVPAAAPKQDKKAAPAILLPAADPDTEDEVATVEMLVYDQPAAAGFGNYLDENTSYEMLSFSRDEVPDNAAFGIRISGDSMEPDISDGDIAWVEERIQIENGQIGIFVLNNEALCKQLKVDHDKRTVHLVSLNKKYEPIRVKPGDALRTIGRVLR